MKVLILYGSLTGNTELVAQQISEVLSNNNIKHDLFNAQEFSPKKSLEYDALILGSSTWDYGQLQEDFASFFNEIENLDFREKQFAIFGCGDSGYEEFCKAVDIIEKFFIDQKAKEIIQSLKVDGYPHQPNNQKLINNWAENLVSKLK